MSLLLLLQVYELRSHHNRQTQLKSAFSWRIFTEFNPFHDLLLTTFKNVRKKKFNNNNNNNKAKALRPTEKLTIYWNNSGKLPCDITKLKTNDKAQWRWTHKNMKKRKLFLEIRHKRFYRGIHFVVSNLLEQLWQITLWHNKAKDKLQSTVVLNTQKYEEKKEDSP